jgi:heavy metal sensor kinase
LATFGWILLGGVPLLLFLASAGGYWMSRRALAPVDRITNTARSITAQNLSKRLDVSPTGDELQRLSETLNTMLERLDTAFSRITRFTADASHELRTPVSLMRTTAELALRRDRRPEEYREALGQVLTELERTSTLIEDLLVLARADSGGDSVALEQVDLAASVAQACEQGSLMAAAKQLQFEVRLPKDPLYVVGDLSALRRLFLILIDNAVKYTPEGGQVRVGLDRIDQTAIAEVADTGIGIADEDLPHIFDRFYRADKARSRAVGGAGLGLSIAQWITNAHHGRIEVESAQGRGTRFRAAIPV